jgi:sec-independent protein translocase protein TatA
MGLDNPLHLAFLLVLLLLVFGARRLPEMGRSLGAGMRGFRDALSGDGGGRSLASDPAQQDSDGAEIPSRAPGVGDARTPGAHDERSAGRVDRA